MTSSSISTTQAPQAVGPIAKRRSGLNSFGWVMFGLLGSLLAFGVGLILANASVDINEDYALLIYVFYGFVCYLGSIVVLTLITYLIERDNRSPRGQFSRVLLTFFGSLIPIGLALFAIFGTQLILGG